MSRICIKCSEKCLRSEYFCELGENVNLHLKFMAGIFFNPSKFRSCFAVSPFHVVGSPGPSSGTKIFSGSKNPSTLFYGSRIV